MKKKYITTENLTLLSIFLGVGVGYFFKEFALNLELIGDAFLSLLKMITIPLIFASIFVSIASLGNISELKSVGLKAILYYTATTFIAVFTGLLIVNLVQFDTSSVSLGEHAALDKEFTFAMLVNSLIPSNIFASLSEGKVLHVIVFASLLALATLKLAKAKKEAMSTFFEALNDAILSIAHWIIALSPVGVFALIAYIVAKYGIESIVNLWQYVVVVVVALLVHAFINLGLIAKLIGGFNPFSYFSAVKEAILIAFSTSSSSATLPVSMSVAEEKGGVKKKTAGFVLPLGATINMDGTALYESIAAMFVASMYGIELTLTQQIVIFFTASLSAIGAAGIPSAGLVTMTLVFSAVGIPLEGIAIILAVDRFLDMVRTSVNVWGDLVGAKVINRFMK